MSWWNTGDAPAGDAWNELQDLELDREALHASMPDDLPADVECVLASGPLTDHDRQAIDEFRAYLAERAHQEDPDT